MLVKNENTALGSLGLSFLGFAGGNSWDTATSSTKKS